MGLSRNESPRRVASLQRLGIQWLQDRGVAHLAGGTARFLSDNPAAIHALLELHPLQLMTSANRPAAAAAAAATAAAAEQPVASPANAERNQVIPATAVAGNATPSLQLLIRRLPEVDAASFAQIQQVQWKLVAKFAAVKEVCVLAGIHS